MSDVFKKRIFSGVQPTGNLTLGNYLGALKNFIPYQETAETLFCIVDQHAITVPQDPIQLKSSIRSVAAAFIASGLDPNKSLIFNQSRVPQHAQLAWILNCVARIGWLNRMTQFKDKAGKNKENASVGLYTYPVLMAADILLYKTTHVPVGEDQRQHIELARDVAIKFNLDYAKYSFFPEPQTILPPVAARIMSLRDGTAKMSKSDSSDMSRINLNDDNDLIAQKFKKAKTDLDAMPQTIQELEGRAEVKNLYTIFASLTDITLQEVVDKFADTNFSLLKEALTEVTIQKVGPIRHQMNKLMTDSTYLDEVMENNANKAQALAQPVLDDIYEIVGFK